MLQCGKRLVAVRWLAPSVSSRRCISSSTTTTSATATTSAISQYGVGCLPVRFRRIRPLLGERGLTTTSAPLCSAEAVASVSLRDAFDYGLHNEQSPSTPTPNRGLLLREEFQSTESFAELVNDVRIAGDNLVRRIAALPRGDVRCIFLSHFPLIRQTLYLFAV